MAVVVQYGANLLHLPRHLLLQHHLQVGGVANRDPVANETQEELPSHLRPRPLNAMVEAGEYALKTGKVKQVILLEHLPRYDVEEKDKDKAELAKLANKELHKARDNSEFAEQILVGKHSGLECEGRTRTTRFTSDHTNGLHGRNIRLGKYDGIHMYSQAGAEALTASLLLILQKAGMVKPGKQVPSPSSSREEQEWIPSHQTRRKKNTSHCQQTPRVQVQEPLWEIPTQNMFQGFY